LVLGEALPRPVTAHTRAVYLDEPATRGQQEPPVWVAKDVHHLVVRQGVPGGGELGADKPTAGIPYDECQSSRGADPDSSVTFGSDRQRTVRRQPLTDRDSLDGAVRPDTSHPMKVESDPHPALLVSGDHVCRSIRAACFRRVERDRDEAVVQSAQTEEAA